MSSQGGQAQTGLRSFALQVTGHKWQAWQPFSIKTKSVHFLFLPQIFVMFWSEWKFKYRETVLWNSHLYPSTLFQSRTLQRTTSTPARGNHQVHLARSPQYIVAPHKKISYLNRKMSKIDFFSWVFLEGRKMPPWGWVFSLSFWLEFCAWVLVFLPTGVKKKAWYSHNLIELMRN